jgi:type IX secretion system substrate protein
MTHLIHRFTSVYIFLLIILNIYSNVYSRNNIKSSNLILQKSNHDSVIINIGSLHNYVSNSTVDFSNNFDWQTFLIGRDDYNSPSMMWSGDGYPNNHYLYSGSFFIGYNQNTIRFNGATSPDFSVIQNDPSLPSPFKVSYLMSDSLADSLRIGIKALCSIYAWPDQGLDDFFIYEYSIINTSSATLQDVYTGLQMDYDISSAGAGTGQQSFYLDDNVESYIGVDLTRVPESISYMYDDDNPFIPNNDKGGKLNPQESLGFAGSRILYTPITKNGVSANKQSGHWWWRTGSAPNLGSDYYDIMRAEQIMSKPLNPSDYKYLQSMGPWDISAGDTLKIALAIGIGKRLVGLRENMQRAYNLYWNVFQPKSIPKITFADPDSGLHIIYWGDSLEFKVNAMSNFSDSLSYHWNINGFYVSNKSESFVFHGNFTNTGSNIITCDVSNGIVTKQIEWIIIVEQERPILSFKLGQNYPNPFNSSTFIPFEINEAAHVEASLYDITGRRVVLLISEYVIPGRYIIPWDGNDINDTPIASGMYFYKIKYGDFTQIKKLMIVR